MTDSLEHDEDISVKRLRACRAAVEVVPPELIDMHDIRGNAGCGCAIYHMKKAYPEIPRDFGLDYKTKNRLFAFDRDTYARPTGQPAKDEFLRRIDAVIAEKLQATQVAPNPLPSPNPHQYEDSMSEWKPIETAPRDRRFLGFRPARVDEFDHYDISVCKYRESGNGRKIIYSEADYDGYPFLDWTHWMPLPTPPHKDQQNNGK